MKRSIVSATLASVERWRRSTAALWAEWTADRGGHAPRDPGRVTPPDVVRVAGRVLLSAAAVSAGMNVLLLAPALYMYQVYDRVLSTRHVETLVYLTLIALLALALLSVLDGVRATLGVKLGAWLERVLAGPLLRATVHGAPLMGQMRGAQALRDLASLRGLFSGGAIWPLLDAPWAPIFFVITFMIHPLLGVVTVIGGLALFAMALANELLTRRALQRAGAATIHALGEADAGVRNADSMMAMGMLPSWLEGWEEKRAAASAPQDAAGIRSGALAATAKAVRMGLQIALLGFGAWLVIERQITSGAMIAASIIASRAVAPFEQAIGSWRSLVAAQSAWSRVSGLLRNAPPAAQPIRLPRPEGRLTVDKLVFTPQGAREAIVRGISFQVPAGELVVIVGPSGAGKSTLARMIVGSLQPSGGSARLDGGAIGDWSPHDRAIYVGYLPQDTELFNGTVRQNIARFTQAADTAVVEAATLAGAHELILSLPRSYETPIGPSGLPLSGGQRQRVGLARAVFGDPRLVVLDEPNSNLDDEGEAALFAALAELKTRGVTVVCIAQKPELLTRADRILRLAQGVVSLYGPREEVMRAAVRAASGARRERSFISGQPAGALVIR